MPALDLDSLLQREGPTSEWKRDVADSEDVVRTLVAFANDYLGGGSGGWVLCGVEEVKDEGGFPRGQIVGLSASRLLKVQGEVVALCRDKVSPPLVPELKEIALEAAPARRLLGFFVPSSPNAHFFHSRKGAPAYWLRLNNRTVQARGEHLHELFKRKQVLAPILERPAVDASLEDLDMVVAEEYLTKRLDLPRPLATYFRPGALLGAGAAPFVKSHESGSGGTKAVPTYLALLLFSREPTRFLRGASVVLAIYDGVSRAAKSSQRFDIAVPLPKLIQDLDGRLDLLLGVNIDKSAGPAQRPQNRPRYPKDAVLEAVVNALAHRDYESPEPTRITLFKDRIEIWNPGGLLPGSNREELVAGNGTSRWRNPGLAAALDLLGFVQNQGQGIPTILRRTRLLTGRPAEIQPGELDFKVVLRAAMPSASAEKTAVDRGEAGKEGLLLISIGAGSVRPVVESSLHDLGLEGSEIVVDFEAPDYVDPDASHWEEQARRIRDEVREKVEDPGLARLHLFYRGPVVLAPLLGALVAQVKPLVVYHYVNGRYSPAYVLERRFLVSRD